HRRAPAAPHHRRPAGPAIPADHVRPGVREPIMRRELSCATTAPSTSPNMTIPVTIRLSVPGTGTRSPPAPTVAIHHPAAQRRPTIAAVPGIQRGSPITPPTQSRAASNVFTTTGVSGPVIFTG